MGITNLSVSECTVFVCMSEWLNLHLILLPFLLLAFFKCKLMQTAASFLLCKVVRFVYVTSWYNHIYIPLLRAVYRNCLPAAHLPGLTAPPAGVGGDVQPPAAGLLGQEGELPDCTANEVPQVDG